MADTNRVRAVNVERELMRSDVGFVTKSKGRRTPTAATIGKRDPVATAYVPFSTTPFSAARKLANDIP